MKTRIDLPEMVTRHRRVVATFCAAAFICLACAGAAWAQRLDKPRQAWLAGVRLLVLPDEVEVLRQLSHPDDLAEFERIFWTRRSPDASATDNPVKAALDKARQVADVRFGDTGRKGSETDCGQVFMLMGPADEITGREIRSTFQTRAGNATRDGARRPELWVYKSSPSRSFKMPGGDLRLQFDDGCESDAGTRVTAELARIAATRVLHPEIRYEFAPNGRLRPLAVAGPRPTGPSWFDLPSADFPLAYDVALQTPGVAGAYSAGILSSGPDVVPSAPPQAGKPLALRVRARAVPQSGSSIDLPERDLAAVVRADGSFLTSYGLLLPPGHYDVKIGVRLPESGKAAFTTVSLDAPDYASKELVVGTLAVLAAAPDGLGATEGVDPYAAFITAGEHLYPRVGNRLTTSDSLRLLVLVHGAALAGDGKKAALRARFSVSKDGKLVARGSEQAFDTASAAPSVGPIALAPFGPGRYLARVEIDDDVAGVHLAREATFEIQPAVR